MSRTIQCKTFFFFFNYGEQHKHGKKKRQGKHTQGWRGTRELVENKVGKNYESRIKINKIDEKRNTLYK